MTVVSRYPPAAGTGPPDPTDRPARDTSAITVVCLRDLMLEEVDEFIEGEPRGFDDGGERSALEVTAMHRNGYANGRPIGMLEDVVTARRVMEKKSRPLKRPNDVSGFEGGQARAHATGMATLTFSLIGSASRSAGMGSWSFIRLSR